MKDSWIIRIAAAVVAGIMLAGSLPCDIDVNADSGSVKYGCRKAKPYNNNATIEYPSSSYKSLQAAINGAQTGTTIIIKDRVEEQIKINKNGITLKGSGKGAICGNETMRKGDPLIQVEANNVVIENLEIADFFIYDPDAYCADGIWIGNGADNVHVLNCKIHHLGCMYGDYKYSDERGDFNAHGICVQGEKDSKVSNVMIKGCELYDLTTCHSESLTLGNNVEYFTVADNSIHDNDNIGLDMAGGYGGKYADDRARNGEVYGNTVYNNSSLVFENPAYLDDDGTPNAGAGGIYVDGGKDIWIHDNFIANCDIGLEIASEIRGWTVEGVIAEHNIILFNDANGGISLGGESSGSNGQALNNVIRYNTVVNTEENCLYVSYSEGNDISNNIFISDAEPVYGKYTDSNSFSNNASNRPSDIPGSTLSLKGVSPSSITYDKDAQTVTIATSVDLKDYGARGTNGKGGKTAVPTKSPATVTPTAKAGATTKPTATPKPGATTKPTSAPTAPDQTPEDLITGFVNRIYIYVLDRQPDEKGVAFWSDEIYCFRRSGAGVAQGFIFSDEFTNRHTSDNEFVTILYRTFFGREPDEAGLNYWCSELASGSKDRLAVANGFIFSQEWADTCAVYGIRSGGDIKPSVAIEPTSLTYAFVERMYTTAMGREYDKEGRKYWATALANFEITGEHVGASFFLSDEMAGYGLSDAEFVDRLYATFMDREADKDGAGYWLGSLGSGTPRADVVFGFTRSAEFTDRCIEARILPY